MTKKAAIWLLVSVYKSFFICTWHIVRVLCSPACLYRTICALSCLWILDLVLESLQFVNMSCGQTRLEVCSKSLVSVLFALFLLMVAMWL